VRSSELAGLGHDEALDQDRRDALAVEGPAHDLPEVARRLHGHDERAEPQLLPERLASGDETLGARGVGADPHRAEASPIDGRDEHHHALPLAQVDARDERVGGQTLPSPSQLLRPSAHATSNLHVGLSSQGGWFQQPNATWVLDSPSS